MKLLGKKNIEFILILFHMLLGIAVFYMPFLSKIFNLFIVSFFIYFTLVSKNKVFSILIAAAYIATSDVFFRMTGGLIF